MKVLVLPMYPQVQTTQPKDSTAWAKIVGEENVLNFFYDREDPNLVDGHLYNTASNFKPDLIYINNCDSKNINPKVIAQLKIEMPVKVVSWCGDYRPFVMDSFVELGKVIDISFLSNKCQLEMYRNKGISVDYLQVGYFDDDFYDMNVQKEPKIAFGGNNYGMNEWFDDSLKRNDLLLTLRRTFGEKFDVYGMGWECLGGCCVSISDMKIFNEVMNKYMITVGINLTNSCSHWFSIRQLVMMATGGLHICHYVEGLEDYFENGKDCVWYHTIDECVDLCRKYLGQPDKCYEIGKRGAELVAKNHTWECRFKEILSRI